MLDDGFEDITRVLELLDIRSESRHSRDGHEEAS